MAARSLRGGASAHGGNIFAKSSCAAVTRVITAEFKAFGFPVALDAAASIAGQMRRGTYRRLLLRAPVRAGDVAREARGLLGVVGGACPPLPALVA